LGAKHLSARLNKIRQRRSQVGLQIGCKAEKAAVQCAKKPAIIPIIRISASFH